MTADVEIALPLRPPSEALRRHVLGAVRRSPHRLTQAALEKAVCAALKVDRKTVRKVIRALVATRELSYTYHFGSSYLEPCYHRPVRVSPRVVIKPPDCRFTPAEGDIVISLAGGAAFGTGEHPTTRLALQAMDWLISFKGNDFTGSIGAARVLDVGTGSGILIIAAMAFGLRSGIGIDVDPCALAEARDNVRLNGLGDRVLISDQAVESLSGHYRLITANLRAPTLSRLAGCLTGLLEGQGELIFSGVRPEEMIPLEEVYAAHGMLGCWQREENGWGAMVFRGNQRESSDGSSK